MRWGESNIYNGGRRVKVLGWVQKAQEWEESAPHCVRNILSYKFQNNASERCRIFSYSGTKFRSSKLYSTKSVYFLAYPCSGLTAYFSKLYSVPYTLLLTPSPQHLNNATDLPHRLVSQLHLQNVCSLPNQALPPLPPTSSTFSSYLTTMPMSRFLVFRRSPPP